MIKWLISAALAPATEIAKLFIQAQNDRDRIDAWRADVAIKADAAVRSVKLGHWMGRLPLFVAELSAACYFSAVLWDSYVATHGWFSPLELPAWFQPHFATALASIFGLATVERIINRRK